MTIVRRLFGGAVVVFVGVGLALAVLQLLLPWPVLLAYGLLLTAAIVLVADPVRVAALTALFLVVGAVSSALDPTPVPGFWQRYPWMVVFGVLAVVLARIERDRLARVRSSARLLAAVVAATDQPFFVKRFSGDGRPASYEMVNRAWRESLGVTNTEGLTDSDFLPPDLVEAISVADQEVLQTGRVVTLEETVGKDEASRRTYLVTKFPLEDDDGERWGVGGIATDVTDRKRAEERLAAVFARSPVAGIRLLNGGDRRTLVLDANEASRRLLGEDVVGHGSEKLARLIHPSDVSSVWDQVDSLVAQVRAGVAPEDAGTVSREVRLVSSGGQVRWAILSVSAIGPADAGGNQELVVQFEDITSRKQAEAALTERALTDSVTGLPNRYALTDRLAMALARLERHTGTVCLLFCDLDRFKEVNDVFGHEAGDTLLREVALRLAGSVRPEDTVGRLGGDEFVVVCEGFDDPVDAAVLAGRLQERLRVPWSFAGHEFVPTASIGIAFTADASSAPGDLLRQADVAMYRAKDSGRDRIEVYDRSLDDELADALAMQQRLRTALSAEGFVLHHQPVVLLDGLRVVGAEALVRMRDGDALLPPGAFLPHAESSGLIGAVGEWVLHQALRELQGWRAGAAPSSIGVNVSPTQLLRAGFARSVLDALGQHRVSPSRLVVEVTETALMSEERTASDALRELHDAGVLIALDDFGTGYSSLSWLHQLPVDIVKVDKSFVQTMADDHRRAVVVRAIIDIADELGIGVVAEGIETEQQLEMLRELGCEAGQGYLLGRPAPADDPAWATRLDPSLSWDEVRGTAVRR